MKVEMITTHGGMLKGHVYITNEKTANWLIANGKAIPPVKFFVKGDDETKAKEPVKRTRKKKA